MTTLMLVVSLLCLSFITHADINRAQQLFDEQRFSQTLKHIDSILATSATHQQALFLKALTQQHLGRTADAIRTYQLLTQQYPKSPEAYNNLAVLYTQQGKHKLARDTLLTALNTHPSYATAYKNLGNIYSHMASNAYSKALDLENKNKPTTLTLATINSIAIPAEKIVFAKLPTSASERKEIALIINTIKGWSSAWSAQNSDAYLAYYADNFIPTNGYSRQRWERDRRSQLRKPSFIRISIQSPNVVLLSKDSARLIFKQNYQSDRFNNTVLKTLLLKKVNGNWKILKEYTAS